MEKGKKLEFKAQSSERVFSSTYAKQKVIKEWMKIFDKCGLGILKTLSKSNKVEFMRLGIALLPKEMQVEVNPFKDLSDSQLEEYIKSGGEKWPTN